MRGGGLMEPGSEREVGEKRAGMSGACFSEGFSACVQTYTATHTCAHYAVTVGLWAGSEFAWVLTSASYQMTAGEGAGQRNA